ncbi:MAG: hypothetical protein HON04_07795 [Planctomicrobium sp.]|jgi:hypothetical protein|nr:hypothetical protein [Planctomicrobium sp.]
MKVSWLLLLMLALNFNLAGCGPGERASTDPVDEMPADQDLTVDPADEEGNP